MEYSEISLLHNNIRNNVEYSSRAWINNNRKFTNKVMPDNVTIHMCYDYEYSYL